jgi:predicted RNA-binding protein (virulence factor B family)
LAAEKRREGVAWDETVLGAVDDFYDVRQRSAMGRCLFHEDGFSIFFVKTERGARLWVGRKINCLVQGVSHGGDTKLRTINHGVIYR